ncbi:MAG: DUF2079 domain-containing protein [Microcystis sp. M090S1]|uniref:DUF2079 domain-containing protein n=1 Tax=Microcystis sp. M090S1 TaxID=2771135 RepID=UPI00258884C9|nr:DUF2079 domain-containing protein [Microcystis sp. M090S1]MCA2811590.1 DUF2079 domain-containing protein [Microcystis sp. M090S1]
MHKKNDLFWLVICSTIILFICSATRHILFQSNALDLGWFDQGVYLISQGKPPIISFVDYHILGDHIAFILYPIALLYKIYPSVYWLLLLQAFSLSLAVFPLWQLAIEAGLKEKQAYTLALVYLLYPLIFNVNLFDFHPEVIAVPAIFWTILAARLNNLWGFCLGIIIILGCKAILSLTLLGMGIWLLLWEKKKIPGIIAMISGILWFIITTKLLIPLLTGKSAVIEMADSRYSYLGDSLPAIIFNLFLKPDLVLGKIFTGNNLEYLILLIIPLVWGLSWRYSAPIIAAIPALALNLLADHAPQKNLTTQYSLPILPFLFLAVIATLAHNSIWLKQPKWIITWAIIAFFALAKYGYFWSLYLNSLDTWSATQKALTQITTSESVLTTSRIAPHLTHREMIKLAIEGSQSLDLNQFNYILLDRRHPGWSSSSELIDDHLNKLNQNDNFQLILNEDDVFLYRALTTPQETK